MVQQHGIHSSQTGAANVRKAQTRSGKASAATIVRASTVTGNSLNLVVIIMCFLACLTAGAAYMINKSAKGWSSSIAKEVTVQVDALNSGMEQKLDKIASYLKRQKYIARVKVISLKESQALLEPWLGKNIGAQELPFPRLIAVELTQDAELDLPALSADLGKRFKGVKLDDHRHWQQQIKTVTRSLALGALSVLALVALATTAIIISATKASMASNKEIVQVLNFVGATDRFIAKEFEKHFLRLGVRAGVLGAVFALGVFLLLPLMMHFLGGSHVTSAEMRRLLGLGGLDFTCVFVMLLVVIVIAGLCMVTSRFSVYRMLQQRN